MEQVIGTDKGQALCELLTKSPHWLAFVSGPGEQGKHLWAIQTGASFSEQL